MKKDCEFSTEECLNSISPNKFFALGLDMVYPDLIEKK